METEKLLIKPLDAKPPRTASAQAGRVPGRAGRLAQFIGPAFIVSVAYIDPGNFAANITGGALFGSTLVWVILWSNLMAIFLQILSAKLGIATGKNLAQVCREVFSKKANVIFYAVAVLASMATTMAEFLGGVLGFYLLFGMPMAAAAVLTALVTFTLAWLQKYGQRIVEIVITVFVGVICAAYALELFLSKPDWTQAAMHALVPSLPNGRALLIAAGMLGATVMPHVIYLHSQLVQYRNGCRTVEEKRRHLRLEKTDIIIAMNIAFIVNAAMLIVSAAVFHTRGITVDSIETAHRSLEPLLGALSSGAFGVALLASGFSSSAVGAMAGETVMDGFVDIKLPRILRRLITMAPGLAVILAGVEPIKALLLSQVSLCFALPAAVIPLLIITGRRELMGPFVNTRWVKLAGGAVAGVIIVLNIALLYFTATGKI